ncbi:ricin B-like lectin R40G3 [Pistacia vera]|uniref:ricin B-like lectin R40G3 n=1 Tax=Pistacia vera TaxID=55513 RepID=UPI001263DB0B|nr:ricin B-like lectin R40G3 [Pistacia vera]
MEFPQSHHHHHRRDEDDEQPPPFNRPPPPPFYQDNEFAPPPPFHQGNEFAPPPQRAPPPAYFQENEFSPPPLPRPYYQEPEYAPPPPQSTHVSHVHHRPTSDQQEFNSFNYQQPPPPTQVSHVAHEEYQSETSHHSFKPHLPSGLHSHSNSASASLSHLANKPTVKVYCKARPDFSLTIRDGKVILATSDPSDEFQHWYKDEKYSTRVKDEEGFPCFSLVNKATGQAMKHSVGASHPVQLVPYNADELDSSILWSEGKDLGDGYRTVRMINNIRLNVDAFHGDKKSGGVHDGTTIVLWQWNKGDNQRWKITPY